MASTEPLIKTQLQQSLWFSELPAAFADSLCLIGTIRTLKAGERLFSRGDARCGIYAVLRGLVRIAGVASSGKEAVLSIIDTGQWFGEIALFDNKARTHDATAEIDTQLWHIPNNALHQLLNEHPEYWQHLGKLLTEKLRLSFIALEDLTILPAPLRLARRLLVLTAQQANHHPTTEQDVFLPQEVLGSMLGISRQTANQILKSFEQQGMVSLERNRIVICNRTALHQFATQNHGSVG